MPIDYAAVRADLTAKRDALDAAIAALDRLDVTFDDYDYLTTPESPDAPPQAAVARRSPNRTSADTADAPPRPRKAQTRRPKAATTDGLSNVQKSRHWQTRALEGLRLDDEPATVRGLATRLRETSDDAYQSLWRALQVLVARKAVVRQGTRYRLAAAAQGEAA